MFYDNFIQLCAKRDISPSGAAKAIGLSNAAASGWKMGKQPSEITLNKLAIFFDVPVSALTDTKEPATQTGDGLSVDDVKRFLKALPNQGLYDLLEDIMEELKSRNA